MKVPFMMVMMGIDGDVLSDSGLSGWPWPKWQIKVSDRFFALALNIPINPHHPHHFGGVETPTLQTVDSSYCCSLAL
jgi:hypothetical protein